MEIIRPSAADFYEIAKDCRAFAKFLAYKHDYLPNEYNLYALFAHWAQNHVFYAAKDADGKLAGMICGEYHQHHWNPGKTILTEHFWWVKPAYRSQKVGRALLEAFLNHGDPSTDNVSAIRFHFESKTPIQSTILEEYGFSHAETVYIKEMP